MRDGTGGGLIGRAEGAVSRGRWDEAFDLLLAADADGSLAPGDLPLLADVAYAAGHLDVTIETWQRVHSSSLGDGDRTAAAGAAVRLAMHLLFDTALMAPVRGWLARADRLLDGDDRTPVHAWLGVVRAYERILTGDADGARPWAHRAVELGAACDPAACAIGRVAEARLMILDGDVPEGLALLDEAGVATLSGELDPLSTGVVYCELVCALQGLAQYDAAEQWTDAMERWCETNAIGSLHGRCRVHRAEILRLRGSVDEAEVEALTACEELRPYLRRELGWPLNEVGRIRLQKGDLAGAEDALLAAQRAGWDPQPGLALVRLTQGDASAAVAGIRAALDHPMRVPSKERPPNTALQRAPLLEAQVEIELAVGDLDRARAAADELDRVAARFESMALVACAAAARGRLRLAEGDRGGAQESLAEAVRRWDAVGAPYEVKVARQLFAEAPGAGRESGPIRAGPTTTTARHGPTTTTARHGPTAVATGADAPPSSSPEEFVREGDYWTVTFAGLTVRVRDRKGMRYLARLLATPGREHHVLDLVAAEGGMGAAGLRGDPGTPLSAPGDAGQMLDARAKEAYRQRLAEIDDDLEEARANGDGERAAQADAERDFLLCELGRAVGLGGRDRRAASASERARSGVTRAVRQAIARIAEHHGPLGEHLDHAIRTGTYCSYSPDPRAPARWRL